MSQPKQQATTSSNLRPWPADKVFRWRLDKIKPYERNARTHSDEQVAQIAASMKQFGVTAPLLVDEDGVLIYGHGRLLAARSLGLAELPVCVAVGWSIEEKAAYRIADNQIALNSGWNNELLIGELHELELAEFDLPPLGFPDRELRAFLTTPEENAAAEQAPPLPKKPIVRKGDLWILGHHRLLCGDATSESDVAICLDGAEPNLMVTDPPYGVNYDPKWRDDLGIDWTGQAQRRSTHPNAKPLKSRSLGKVQNDHEADWTPAWKLFDGKIAYVWHGGLHAGVVQATLEAAGFAIRAQIIWAKQHFVFSRGDYHWQHEPCWYAVRGTGDWKGDRKQTTVWNIANASAFHGEKDDTVTGHGTQKPIDCMKRPIENNSKPGDFVYEPFAGSGTTIIAAEMTGRKALAIEIDPAYVQVCIERWQTFTGEKATLNGKTFEQVAKARKSGRATGDTSSHDDAPVVA